MKKEEHNTVPQSELYAFSKKNERKKISSRNYYATVVIQVEKSMDLQEEMLSHTRVNIKFAKAVKKKTQKQHCGTLYLKKHLLYDA